MDSKERKEWRGDKKCVHTNLDLCKFVQSECHPGDTFSRNGEHLEGVGMDQGIATPISNAVVQIKKDTIVGEDEILLTHEEIEALYFHFIKGV